MMDRRVFLRRGTVAFAVPTALAISTEVSASEYTDVQLAFSPHGGAEALVLRTIASARRSIRLLGYSFTSSTVVRALLEAKQSRNVDVAVTVDYRNNIEEDRSGKARSALNTLVHAGIPVRTVSVFPDQHSKFCVIDGVTVQTGSYNYSRQAIYNSENALVLVDRPDLAAAYLANWKEVTALGEDYRAE